MTVSLYMSFPGVDGDVQASGFNKHIELLSFNFSVDRHLNTQPGRAAQRESSKPAVSEVIIKKHVDRVSPLLFGKATKAQAVNEVKIHFVKTGRELTKYLTVSLSDVIVSKYALSCQPDSNNTQDKKAENLDMETISLNFTAVELNFVPTGADGKATSQVSDKYDIALAS